MATTEICKKLFFFVDQNIRKATAGRLNVGKDATSIEFKKRNNWKIKRWISLISGLNKSYVMYLFNVFVAYKLCI